MGASDMGEGQPGPGRHQYTFLTSASEPPVVMVRRDLAAFCRTCLLTARSEISSEQNSQWS